MILHTSVRDASSASPYKIYQTLCIFLSLGISQGWHAPTVRLQSQSPSLTAALKHKFGRPCSSKVMQLTMPCCNIVNSHNTYVSISAKIDASNQNYQQEHSDLRTRSIVHEIFSLGIPALGGMLIDPVMSLVDTGCVGQISSLQVAALAPCTSIYQFFFTIFFFLSATTTNLVASNPTDSEELSDEEIALRMNENEKVVSCAATLAISCGLVVTAVLLCFTDPLLRLAGCTSPAMIIHSRKYLRIRALGLPFVLVATSLQGASLGRQDTLTPLKIFASAGLLNFVGDALLTLRWGWGLVGAAWSTVVSQVVAAIYFSLISIRIAEKKKKKTVRLTWKGIPSKKLVKTFGSLAISLMLKSVTCISAYSLMTKSAATMGTLSLAAHQVTLQVWWLLSYLPEPAVAAAYSLVARDIKNNPWQVSKLVKVLYALSVGAGLIAGLGTGLMLTVPLLSRAIVADAAVRSILSSMAGPAICCQLLSAVSYLTDSLTLACGEYWYVPMNCLFWLVNMILALNWTKQRGMGVVGVWVSSFVFFGGRILGHLILSKKLKKYLLSKNS